MRENNQHILTSEELHAVFRQVPLEAQIELSAYIREKSRRCNNVGEKIRCACKSEKYKLEKRKERQMNRLDKNFSENIVSHDCIYFETGTLVEVQLFKDNECGDTQYRKEAFSWRQGKESSITEDQSSMLKLFIETRIEAVLEKRVLKDENYQKINMETRRKIKKIDDIGLSREQWFVVDDALSACNNRSSLYGKTAYYQGFEDAVCLLKQIYQLV